MTGAKGDANGGLALFESYVSVYETRRFRQKARKFWDYLVTDKLVYAPEDGETNSLVGARYLEQYLASNVWFEVLFGIARPGGPYESCAVV